MTWMASSCRLFIVAGAAAAALASSSSSSNRAPTTPASYGDEAPPPSQPMDPARATGLWKSNFGPVKIENDPEGGPGGLRGVWVYEKNGAQVIGSFAGVLDGNVLQFRWMEPGQPADLVGDGYVVFETAGRTFDGRWWTSTRDRGGDWQGWRQEEGGPEGPPPGEPGMPADGVPGPAEQAPPDEPPPPASESI